MTCPDFKFKLLSFLANISWGELHLSRYVYPRARVPYRTRTIGTLYVQLSVAYRSTKEECNFNGGALLVKPNG